MFNIAHCAYFLASVVGSSVSPNNLSGITERERKGHGEPFKREEFEL